MRASVRPQENPCILCRSTSSKVCGRGIPARQKRHASLLRSCWSSLSALAIERPAMLSRYASPPGVFSTSADPAWPKTKSSPRTVTCSWINGMVARCVTCIDTTHAKVHGGSAWGYSASAARCMGMTRARTFSSAIIAQFWSALGIYSNLVGNLFPKTLLKHARGRNTAGSGRAIDAPYRVLWQ
jgi:hypothetical protein